MSSQPRRFLDKQRNAYFIYDRQKDEYVYEDGTRRPRPESTPIETFYETPRTLPNLTGKQGQSSAAIHNAAGSRSSQGVSSTSRNRPAGEVQSLSVAPASLARQGVYGSPTQEPAYTVVPGRSSAQQPFVSNPDGTSAMPRSGQQQRFGSQSLSGAFGNLAVNPPQNRNIQPRQEGQAQYGYPLQGQAVQQPPRYPPQSSIPAQHQGQPTFPPQAAQPMHPGQFPRQEFERNGLQYVSTYNPNSDVRTTIVTAPRERITDAILLQSGIRAHGMLIGSGNEGETERLYSTFKIRPHGFFVVGRVFLVLWVEPAGGTVVTALERDDGIIPGRYRNEFIYSKVRRFVVIREGDAYCSALPIASYGHRGVGKPGVKKSEHAIIYTGPEPGPAPLPQESPDRSEHPMRSISIRVVPDNPTDMLDPESRIDFGKVNTVQHNIKVRPFGMVHQNSLNALHTQFSNVWHGEANFAAARETALAHSIAQSSQGSAARRPGTSSGGSQAFAGTVPAASTGAPRPGISVHGQSVSGQRPTPSASDSAGRSITFASNTTLTPSSSSGQRQMTANSTTSGGSRTRTAANVSTRNSQSDEEDDEEEDDDDDSEEEAVGTQLRSRSRQPVLSSNPAASRAMSQSSQSSQSAQIVTSVKQVVDAYTRLRRDGRTEADSRALLAGNLRAANPGMAVETAAANINTRFAYNGLHEEGYPHADIIDRLARGLLVVNPNMSMGAAKTAILNRLGAQR